MSMISDRTYTVDLQFKQNHGLTDYSRHRPQIQDPTSYLPTTYLLPTSLLLHRMKSFKQICTRLCSQPQYLNVGGYECLSNAFFLIINRQNSPNKVMLYSLSIESHLETERAPLAFDILMPWISQWRFPFHLGCCVSCCRLFWKMQRETDR